MQVHRPLDREMPSVAYADLAPVIGGLESGGMVVTARPRRARRKASPGLLILPALLLPSLRCPSPRGRGRWRARVGARCPVSGLAHPPASGPAARRSLSTCEPTQNPKSELIRPRARLREGLPRSPPNHNLRGPEIPSIPEIGCPPAASELGGPPAERATHSQA